MSKDSSAGERSNLSLHLTFFRWVAVVIWTFVVGGSMLLNSATEDESLIEVAKASARSSIDKDIIYRSWNSHYGGVFVKSKQLPDGNLYSSEGLYDDDVSTDDGASLTLLTPSIMTRQVQDLGTSFGVESGHLASLIPMNAENAPDFWEEEALRQFDWGLADEVSEVRFVDGDEYLRMMRPLTLAQDCLPCHANQGYTLGEVRGGISQRVPMAPLRAATQAHGIMIGAGHVVIWILGVGGIVFGHRRLAEQVGRRDKAEAQIRHMATHDELTGLPNRKQLLDRLERCLLRSDRSGLRTAVLFLDLDEFKHVNDTYGHEAGDMVLKDVATRLSDCIRATDVAARVGGDEFVVVLSELPGADSVARVANEVLELICVPINLPQDDVTIGASVGIAFYPDNAAAAERLIAVADEAMYEVKRLGKNGFNFASTGRMDTIPLTLTMNLPNEPARTKEAPQV
ncbi:MAG: diguanylate cyclase [Rhodospirillales bacterium]|nr:diguanylate cyclase [Rhodospirillales bacterium]